MTLKMFKKIMTDELFLPGYTFDVSRRGSLYKREDEEWTYMITIDNFSNGGEMRAFCSGGTLGNKQVKSILSKVSARYPTVLQEDPVTFVGYKEYRMTDTRDRRIVTEQDLREVIPVWAEDIRLKVIPFLESWNDLERIDNEIIKKVQIPELFRYLPGETSFKKLIIMRLVNDPGFDGFFLERLEALQKGLAEGKEQYRPNLEALLELKGLLG